MTTPREHRRKARQERAAARRLPPASGHGGRRVQTGGRPSPVRLVGVGQFAQGVSRRTRSVPGRSRPRWVSLVISALVLLLLVLWIVARVVGHL